ncbi:MAG: phosphate regulon sensor histidine kinase PhoR [Ideonella sp.]|nr:phosphate regulon sensor histidine kinase PhoR [Ideonella sp.]
MIAWLPRLVVALLVLVAGGTAGHWAGASVGAPMAGLCAGAVLALSAWLVADEWRVQRLMRWLHTASETEAPGRVGLWADMGYRIERELRVREQALADERERLAQFLSGIEASPNGVLLLDAEDQIAWCSRVAAEHLGLDARRDLLQPITNLVRNPDFVACVKASAGDEAVVIASPVPGTTLSVLVRRHGAGQKLVLTQDVTERHRLETMRRDFVANVSHEIRTPLTVLAGFVETMASLPLSDTERRRVLALMQEQTTRMQVLVADLLTLSQLEGSPRPTVDRWVSLDALVRRAMGDARGLSKGRHGLVAPADTHLLIAGAESELQSALGNLLSNAVRYTPEGGRIEVRWRRLGDGSGSLSVVDNGPGIAREHLPRLTERFYRVDGSRSRETGGTGLGLSIVKHVMQRHGGELQIDSEPGRGSSFTLHLPSVRLGTEQPTALSADTPA